MNSQSSGSPAKVYRGRCFCASVRYQITTPLKFLVHDHCTLCRRVSGAPLLTWGGVMEDEQFLLLEGASCLGLVKSTSQAERQFCMNCGTHLFFRSSKWPGELHFTWSSIVGPTDEVPTAHVYFSDKVDWLRINDDLPQYGGSSGLELLEEGAGGTLNSSFCRD